jgi:hypothetical protein
MNKYKHISCPDIKKEIDKSIKKNGIKITKNKTIAMRDQSIKIKNRILSSNGKLVNIPSHIEMADEILDYLDELIKINRDKKISSILGERKIASFEDFLIIEGLF